MNLGGLRQQIELLTETRVADEAGGRAVAYAPETVLWTAIEHLPSAVARGEQLRRVRRIKAFVRSRPDLALGRRLRFDGADYEIVSIESDDEKGRRVFLIGEEREQ